MDILELEKTYKDFNFQNLNQYNIRKLCEDKAITSLVIKRFKRSAWIWCFDGSDLVGVSKKYTSEQADLFYDKMSSKYGV